MARIKQQIETLLNEALSPQAIDVIDDSASHAGHAGASAEGESHFTVDIVSTAFEGQSRVQRHRLVNQALSELLKERVHALAIKARAPGEL